MQMCLLKAKETERSFKIYLSLLGGMFFFQVVDGDL